MQYYTFHSLGHKPHKLYFQAEKNVTTENTKLLSVRGVTATHYCRSRHEREEAWGYGLLPPHVSKVGGWQQQQGREMGWMIATPQKKHSTAGQEKIGYNNNNNETLTLSQPCYRLMYQTQTAVYRMNILLSVRQTRIFHIMHTYLCAKALHHNTPALQRGSVFRRLGVATRGLRANKVFPTRFEPLREVSHHLVAIS